MLIYEDFVPLERIKPRATKLPNAKKSRVARGFLVNKNALNVGVTKLSPYDVIKEAAKYGISVDHLFRTESVTAALFRRMEDLGEDADELAALSPREFIQRAEFHGLLDDPRLGSLDVRADLFWSVEDNAPLVAMYLVPRDQTQAPWLHRIFNAEWATFESGLSVSPQDIERAKAIRLNPAAPGAGHAPQKPAPRRGGQWRLTMLDQDGQLTRVALKGMRLPYESREQTRAKIESAAKECSAEAKRIARERKAVNARLSFLWSSGIPLLEFDQELALN
jgi:hypothetical protein